VAEAKPRLLRIWAQAHGTAIGGQGVYFEQNGPYLGGAGQIGLALLVFEIYLDVNVFDTGRDQGEVGPTMWNQLGAGLNVPISFGKLSLFGRLDAGLTFAPYADDNESGGFVFRGGGGIEFKATEAVRLGGACYGGYHFFGTRSANENGRHIMGQIYTRFELGF
jgi:hypothetical protein